MNSDLHRVDPPSTAPCGEWLQIGAGALTDRLGRPVGFPNSSDDGWSKPRWAEADSFTGGQRPQQINRLRSGTNISLAPADALLAEFRTD